MSRASKKEYERLASPTEGLGRSGMEEGFVEVERKGATKPYVTVEPGFAPILTERQKTASGRRFRVRTARAWGRMFKTMADTEMTVDEFVAGLSNEELARGQLRSTDGTFVGRPPSMVPRAFHRACIAELMRRGKTLWQENYLSAIEAMTDIAKGVGAGKHATPSERIKAAQFVIERLEGKVPEKLIVETDQPWQLVIGDIVADVTDEAIRRGQAALNGAQVVEAELVSIVNDDRPPSSQDPSRRTGRRPAARRK